MHPRLTSSSHVSLGKYKNNRVGNKTLDVDYMHIFHDILALFASFKFSWRIFGNCHAIVSEQPMYSLLEMETLVEV